MAPTIGIQSTSSIWNYTVGWKKLNLEWQSAKIRNTHSHQACMYSQLQKPHPHWCVPVSGGCEGETQKQQISWENSRRSHTFVLSVLSDNGDRTHQPPIFPDHNRDRSDKHLCFRDCAANMYWFIMMCPQWKRLFWLRKQKYPLKKRTKKEGSILHILNVVYWMSVYLKRACKMYHYYSQISCGD